MTDNSLTDSFIRYEMPTPSVARLVLARSDKRNAINPKMIYDLNAAFDRALLDNAVKVIILAADGAHFSAGHDISETTEQFSAFVQSEARSISGWSDFEAPGAHGWYSSEREAYLEMARRWRNLAKPTIAAVQGKCIAGALIFAWVCDLIIAADSAVFSDPVVTFGVSGVEWLAHPWELGHRKAKELLFTSDTWNAQEAWRLGMVNHVVPEAELASFTLAMAEKIALKPAFALKMSKEAVNKTLDIQGQMNAIDAAFSLHHLCHNQNFRLFGWGMDPTNAPRMSNLSGANSKPSK